MADGFKFPNIPTWGYAVGAGVLGGGYLLYRRRKAAAAPTASGAPVGAVATPLSQEAVDQQSTIAALTQQLADLQGAQSTSLTTQPYISDYTPPNDQTTSGYGLVPRQGTSSIVGPNGKTYSLIANAKARNDLIAAGQTVYYQPAAGVFQPFNLSKMAGSHTPTYVAVQ